MRHGTTLVELLVTLVVFGIVLGLVTQAALFHEQLQRRLQAADAATRATGQATAIVAAAIADAAPRDLMAARSSDSSIELMAAVGDGVACASGAELRTATQAAAGDPPLAAFVSTPRPGDRLLAFDGRARPPRWRARTVVALAPAVQPCAAVDVPPAAGLVLLLDSTLEASPVAAFRLLRRTRYDLYRGGDRRWYLGMREWNAQAQAFNGVQPVAGPLHAYSARGERTGLRFEYFDSLGDRVILPAGSTTVARVTITARGDGPSTGVATRSVALRRAP